MNSPCCVIWRWELSIGTTAFYLMCPLRFLGKKKESLWWNCIACMWNASAEFFFISLTFCVDTWMLVPTYRDARWSVQNEGPKGMHHVVLCPVTSLADGMGTSSGSWHQCHFFRDQWDTHISRLLETMRHSDSLWRRKKWNLDVDWISVKVTKLFMLYFMNHCM